MGRQASCIDILHTLAAVRSRALIRGGEDNLCVVLNTQHVGVDNRRMFSTSNRITCRFSVPLSNEPPMLKAKVHMVVHLLKSGERV